MVRLMLSTALLVALSWPAVINAAATNDSSGDLFSEYVEENGKKYEVADPLEDPNESDSIQQDSTAEWQTEMIQSLFKQRKAEKDFIDKLEIGGKTLSAMVNNITQAFASLEKARQLKGSQLIREHFENEVKQLKNSQSKILSDLKDLLAAKSTDSAALTSIKAQVLANVINNFKQQVQDEKDLFTQQIHQIQQEHSKQIDDVKKLFTLINNWKNAFQTGLSGAQKNLEYIAESWDML